jgi:hypothetical protein
MKDLKLVKAVRRDRMSWTVSIAGSPRYIYIVIKGKFDLLELNEMLDDVCAIKDSYPDHQMLFSDLQFDSSPIRNGDVASVSTHFIMKNPSLSGSKVAIVMKSDQNFRVANLWRSITEPSSTARLHVFRTERNAMKWLALAP